MVHAAPPHAAMPAPPPAAGSAARQALTDSAIALAFACAGIAMFIPPMVHTTVESLPRILASGLVIAVATPLHWVWLAKAARALGRSPVGPLAAAVLLFPVGGALALALLARPAPGHPGATDKGDGA